MEVTAQGRPYWRHQCDDRRRDGDVLECLLRHRPHHHHPPVEAQTAAETDTRMITTMTTKCGSISDIPAVFVVVENGDSIAQNPTFC